MGTPASSATAVASAAAPAGLPPGTIAVQFPGTTPLDTFVDSANGTAYVQTLDNVLHAINVATGTVTASIPLGFPITGEATDPATDTIYLGSDRGAAEKITVVDGATNTVARTIKLPNGYGPDSLVFDPSSGLLYAGMVHNGVVAIDPPSGTITATAGLFETSWDSTYLALDPQHHQLYAVPFLGPALVINTISNTVTRSFPASGAGEASAVSPSLSSDGSTLYISRGSAVASYATGTGHNIGETFFPSSEAPDSDALDSTAGVLYQVVFTAFNNSLQLYVAQVNSKATAVTGTIPLPSEGPAGQWIALDPQTETLIYAGSPASPASQDNTQVLLIPLTGTGTISSTNSATFTTGKAGTFAVKAAGTPAPTFSESGKLPSGVRLNATGTLSGTSKAGTGGDYRITITADNGRGAAVSQQFTLTVRQAAAITSANHATFTHGRKGKFTVQTTGYPAATVKEHGTLPPGVRFTAARNGTATIAGTPASTARGKTYIITLTAGNGVVTATQRFTLKVG